MKKFGSTALWKVSGGLIGVAGVLAILITGNFIVSRMRLRADLTGEKLYTLSAGSRTILENLDQDVTLKLFFSSSAPEVPPYIKNYAREVEDLLEEYRLASRGKLTVETYDPQPDSDAEEWAQRYGLTGQPLDMFSAPVYFGLVAVMGSSEATIPALNPQTEALLEYSLTRLIYRVAHPEKPVIGVMSALPVLGNRMPFPMPGQPRSQSAPWMIFQDLGGDYSFREVPVASEAIDPDIDTLVVIHPKDLSERTLFALDQFVLRGGHVVAFVDPLCLADMESSASASPFGMPRTSSDLGPLFGAWGIQYQPDQVVADLRAASRIRVSDSRIEESPVWLSLGAPNLSRADILTSQLESIMLPFAGAVTATSTKDLTVTPLILSSESACTINSMSAQMGGQAIRGSFKSTGTPIPMAVRLVGKFKTAFPGGKPPPAPPAAGEPAPPEKPTDIDGPALTEGHSVVIVVADVDMLFDRFCAQEVSFFGAKTYQPLNDNIILFANAVEQTSGSADLVSIRSRGRFARPFDRVLALQEKAMADWQEKEKDLEEKLRETQEQLRELQTSKDKNQRFILSEDQKRAIASFRDKEIQIKQDLKLVRKNLRQDIESLGARVKTINIVLMPVLVGIAGLGFGIYRRKLKTIAKQGKLS